MIEITYFTDPYCSWCWATEPILMRLRETYRGQVKVRYVLGGLVRDMSEFFDSLNGIGATAEVAPHWRMVSERSGQPIDENLMTDITDPHWSTWPACIAVKAAQLQGEATGEAYLRRMRRAALTERKVVSDPAIYNALAGEVNGLDLDSFHRDLESGAAEKAFHEDLAECRRYGVSGFPSMLLERGDQQVSAEHRPVLANGHRSFATYNRVIQQLAPELEELTPREMQSILAERGPLTTRELAEIYVTPLEEMREQLRLLATAGRVVELPVRNGELWALHSKD